MAPRAQWKGHLRLSLVSCAVALYTATSTSGRIRFNIINRTTGNRVRNEVVDADTGEPVDNDDRVKGYKIDRGRYVLVEDEEIEKVSIESTHTIDIESFVPRAEVDEIYLDESYYLAPNDKVGTEAFSVIREAMAKEKLVGLARVVLNRRERILMLEPRGRGLIATTLRYAGEVREEDAYFKDIPKAKVPEDMLELATDILNRKKARFDPAKFEDRYEEALCDLIKAKRAGKEWRSVSEPGPSNVVNLMDALRRSVKSDKGATAEKPAQEKATQASAKRPAARKTAKAAKTAAKTIQGSSARRASGNGRRLKKAG